MDIPSYLIIAGPTASGKSTLALYLAELFGNGCIINADSLQLYRHLKILTAHPDHKAYDQAPHKLYGVIDDPSFIIDAAWWQDQALGCIKQANASGLVPIIVGGTGLYLRTLTHGIALVPEISLEVRSRVRNLIAHSDRLDLERLYRDYLNGKEPQRPLPRDPQRFARALEVLIQTGQEISSYQGVLPQNILGKGVNIYLNESRDILEEQAHRRITAMLAADVIQEVKAFLDLNPKKNWPLMRAIGLQEIKAHLEGQLTREQAVELMTRETRRYIKRQQTWFNGQFDANYTFKTAEEGITQLKRIFTQKS